MSQQLDSDLAESERFSLAEARQIVHDLFTPNPLIYWADFLITIMLGHTCYFLTRNLFMRDIPRLIPESPMAFWALAAGTLLLTSVLYYRAAMFIHELVHLRTGTFTVFRVVWNVLCGIPLFVPSFVYYTHVDHHRRKLYGTEADGEYLPLGQRSPVYMLYYLAQILLIPMVVYLRFLLLTPLGWFIPAVRRWTYRHASSMVMDPLYMRPAPTKSSVWLIYFQEFLTFVYSLAIVVTPLVSFNRWPYPFLIQGYAVAVVVMMLNHVRTMGAHRWLNDGRTEMTFVDQLLDSVNYPRWSLASLIWGPVGLRYHALHHLFPSLPYHSLAEAHRRLMERLPEDSPYRRTNSSSLTSALLELLRHSIAAKKRAATVS